MPELPEVESIRRDLDKEVTGRTIQTARVLETKNAMRVIRRYSRREDFEDQLKGVEVRTVERRGKYLLLILDNQTVLVIHLGMSGQVVLAPPADPWAGHTHVVFDFADGGQLRYVDPRTFGEVFVADRSDLGEIAELNKLGLDPLAGSITWEEFSAKLRPKKTKLKSLLMDQGFVAGIGNIYSDEILFAAGLRWDRSSETLTVDEQLRLYEAIHEILRQAVLARGTSMRDEQYRDLYGSLGGFQDLLKVYQREGQSCVRCGSTIQRARWSNRSTHFCPGCQV
jgi:formamidopyrimidine-DNA glycosylase